MANPQWPVTLPTSPLIANMVLTYADQNATFQPDAGLSSSWPRSSMAKLTQPYSFRLTSVQKDALIAFWKTTCKTGSLVFDITDVISATTVTAKFSGSIRVSASPGVGARPWLVEFELERLA